METTSRTRRIILAVIAALVGVFMIAGAPFLIQTSLDRVLTALVKVSAERPAFASGVPLFSLLFPIYRGLIFVGGITLVLLAIPIAKGREWTYPVSLLAAAFPSAGGVFMFMPYVSFVHGFPVPMVVSMVGLTFFWAMILLRNADRCLKWGHFLALTFAGMLSTHAFITGTGNLRMLLTRPEKPMFAGLGTWVLAWSAPVQWICVILLFLAIFHVAAGKPSGWWILLVATCSLLVMDVTIQTIRLATIPSTGWDYSYGLPVIAGLLFTLFNPGFKNALLAPQGK